MFFIEQDDFSEDEALIFLEAMYDPENNDLKTSIIDPIINVMETPKGKQLYISYGDEFLEANSLMLSKEFPTKPVSFPRKYVDGIFEMFGFEQKAFKELFKGMLKNVSDKSEFKTIIANPTNIIHSIVLIYSDMSSNVRLRDSARQQMGLSIYNNVFNHFFKPPHPIESTMAYVYLSLDNSWNLVKSENIINWIGMTIDTSYAFFRTKLDLNADINILVKFLNRVRTSFNQNMRLIANKYFPIANDPEKNNLIGSDVDSNDMYVETNNTLKYRQAIVRHINAKDQLYTEKNDLYTGIARLKNVKMETLYEFAQQIETSDIEMLIDMIFYVFIVKEGNTINDINSTKYIGRITNFPTAVDRAIEGRPVITLLANKYKIQETIVKAYICLIATYIMYRINDSRW